MAAGEHDVPGVAAGQKRRPRDQTSAPARRLRLLQRERRQHPGTEGELLDSSALTFGSAAPRADSVVAPVKAVAHELLARQRLAAGMCSPHVLEVLVVIGRADSRAQRAPDPSQCFVESLAHGGSTFTGTREGRFLSNISKIRLYSSAHDEGLTKAWSSTG